QRDDNETGIIDGQQRLTCITMLFSAICNVFKAHGDERAKRVEQEFLGTRGFEKDAELPPKLTLNKTNNEVFVQHVLASVDRSDIDQELKDKKIHRSNRLLLEAYRYFLEKIA